MMIANQIQAALLSLATTVDAHLADIDRRLVDLEGCLTAIEQAVSEPGTSPDQAAVDALTAQAASATAGLNQSTGGLEAAITQERTQP